MTVKQWHPRYFLPFLAIVACLYPTPSFAENDEPAPEAYGRRFSVYGRIGREYVTQDSYFGEKSWQGAGWQLGFDGFLNEHLGFGMELTRLEIMAASSAYFSEDDFVETSLEILCRPLGGRYFADPYLVGGVGLGITTFGNDDLEPTFRIGGGLDFYLTNWFSITGEASWRKRNMGPLMIPSSFAPGYRYGQFDMSGFVLTFGLRFHFGDSLH